MLRNSFGPSRGSNTMVVGSKCSFNLEIQLILTGLATGNSGSETTLSFLTISDDFALWCNNRQRKYHVWVTNCYKR